MFMDIGGNGIYLVGQIICRGMYNIDILILIEIDFCQEFHKLRMNQQIVNGGLFL